MQANVPQLSKEIEEGIAFNLSANFIPTDLTRLPIESVERQRGYISLLQYGHHHLWYKLKLPLIFSRFIRLLFLTSLRAEATYGFVVTRDSSSLSIEQVWNDQHSLKCTQDLKELGTQKSKIAQKILKSEPKHISFQQKFKIVLILSQLDHLTLDYIENYPKKYPLVKKLAFTKVCYFESNNQVTLLLQF